MIKASHLRKGNVIRYKGDLYKIIEDIQPVQPGKGGTYVPITLKSLESQQKKDMRFNSSDNIEKIEVIQDLAIYSYREKDFAVFFKTKEKRNKEENEVEDFDPIEVPINFISYPEFLKEGIKAYLIYEIDKEKKLIDTELLVESISYEIISTAPPSRHQNAAASYKNAAIEGDIPIKVPMYVEVGEKIKIKLNEGKAEFEEVTR